MSTVSFKALWSNRRNTAKPGTNKPPEGVDAIIQEEAQKSQACACVPAIDIRDIR